MKRFIGYILLCASIIFGAVVGFVPSVLSINPSADYSNGQNFIYKITEKQDSDKNEGDILNGSAIKEVTEIFKERLDNVNITSYKLEAEGEDTIRVSFKAEKAINLAVADYLNFDWGFQAMNYSGDIMLESEDFFESGKAEINYDNNFPEIVIELSNPEEFKNKLYENTNGKNQEDDDALSVNRPIFDKNISYVRAEGIAADGEAEEKVTSNENFIYIVNNWNTEYSMEKVITNIDSADTKEINAYIDRIDSTNPENVYFDYDKLENTKTCEKLLYTGFLANAGSDLALANKLAVITCAKFNSTKLNYNITLTNKDVINEASNNSGAFIENLISHSSGYGSLKQLAFSSLLIAVILAFVVVTVFTFLNYGISALSNAALTPSILLIALALFNLFGAEFNIGAIIALIIVACVSLFSVFPYIRTLKEECYKGKNIKKANEEASKKTLMMQIDLSVISLVFGLVAYLIPNSYMASAGVFLILGGLLNIVINGIFLRIMMYFLSNSSYISENLKLLKIDRKFIPDLTKDEKATYFEEFKKPVKKPFKNKFLGIGAIVILMASLIGIVSFSIATGNIYNVNSNRVSTTRAYIEFNYNENAAIKDVSSLENKVLNHLYTFENGKTTDNKLNYSNPVTYTYSYKENYSMNNEILKKVYFVFELSSIKSDDTLVSAFIDQNTNLEGVVLEDALRYLIVDYNSVSNLNDVSIKMVRNVNNDSNNLYCLIWGAITSGIVLIYFAFRFGISRGVATFAVSFGTMLGITGIFSLVRIPFDSVVTFGIMIISLVVISVLDYIFTKEKIYFKDDRLKLNTLEDKKNESNLALNLSFADIIPLVGICSLLIVSFGFTSSFKAYSIIFVILGLLFACWYIRYALFDVVYSIKSFFSKAGNLIKKKHDERLSKKPINAKNKESGDGPEEATFIGIND